MTCLNIRDRARGIRVLVIPLLTLLLALAAATSADAQAGGSKQVVYHISGHIHELSVTLGGRWQHADLTQLTGAPPASGPSLSGYAWEAGGSKQVVYRTAEGHIHELSVTLGGRWQHADLTQLAGAPPAIVGLLSGYAWEAGGSKQVVYRAADGDIHELSVTLGGTWQDANLTELTGTWEHIPVVLSGYAWEAGGSKQVVYQGIEGHIHELCMTLGGTWQRACSPSPYFYDLTQLTGAPRALVGTPLSGYAWEAGGSKQVAYQDREGRIHELSVTLGGRWQHADLTQLAGVGWRGRPLNYVFNLTGYAWE